MLLNANMQCALFRRIGKLLFLSSVKLNDFLLSNFTIKHNVSYQVNQFLKFFFSFINMSLISSYQTLAFSALIFNESLLHTLSQCQRFTYTRCCFCFFATLALLHEQSHKHRSDLDAVHAFTYKILIHEISMTTHENRIAAMHINNRTHNAEL